MSKESETETDSESEPQTGRSDRYSGPNKDHLNNEGETDTGLEVKPEKPQEDTANRTAMDDTSNNWEDETGLPKINPPSPDDQRKMPPLLWGRDSVKDFRKQVHMFLQGPTQAGMDNAENYFKQKYRDQTVLSLDVREAIVLAGLLNIEDADAFMQAWGYGMDFDFDG